QMAQVREHGGDRTIGLLQRQLACVLVERKRRFCIRRRRARVDRESIARLGFALFAALTLAPLNSERIVCRPAELCDQTSIVCLAGAYFSVRRDDAISRLWHQLPLSIVEPNPQRIEL